MAAVPAPAAPSSTGEKYFSCLKKKERKKKQSALSAASERCRCPGRALSSALPTP